MRDVKPHPRGNPPRERMIYVCDNCLQASCWAGEFMCDSARSAGLFRARISDLRRMALEHRSYWDRADLRAPDSDRRTPILPQFEVDIRTAREYR